MYRVSQIFDGIINGILVISASATEKPTAHYWPDFSRQIQW